MLALRVVEIQTKHESHINYIVGVLFLHITNLHSSVLYQEESVIGVEGSKFKVSFPVGRIWNKNQNVINMLLNLDKTSKWSFSNKFINFL